MRCNNRGGVVLRGMWRGVRGAALLAGALLGTRGAVAQKAAAVPSLDLNKLTGTWYEVARLPVKAEKKCLADGTVLYALNDKRDTFQRGIFCTVKGGDHNDINDSGRQNQKTHDGKLQIRHWVLLHRPYWVLATAPDFTWALVGTPNHKALWVLSRSATVAPETYRQMQDIASAQGFPVAKLMPVMHHAGGTTIASPSANPSQIETPAPTPTATGAAQPGK